MKQKWKLLKEPASTYLSSFRSYHPPLAHHALGTMPLFSIPPICQVPTRATVHAVHFAWNTIPLTSHKTHFIFFRCRLKCYTLRKVSN